MKRAGNTGKNGWKWAAGMLVVLLIVVGAFLSFQRFGQIHAAASDFSVTDRKGNVIGADFSMSRNKETLSISAPSKYAVTDYTWKIQDAETVELGAGTFGGTVNGSKTQVTGSGATGVEFIAKKVGGVGLTITVTYTDNTDPANPLPNQKQDITIQIKAPYSIYGELKNVSGVLLKRIKAADTKQSIVMDPGTTVGIGSTASDENNISLIVGNAQDATWTTSNKEIVDVENHIITAKGAGNATLTYTLVDGQDKLEETVTVYVKPKVMVDDPNGGGRIDVTTLRDPATGQPIAISMKNNDYVYVENADRIPGMDMGDRVEWAIGKSMYVNNKLTTGIVQDCKNQGQGEATLIWNANKQAYRLKAKAGEYVVFFYPAGTYEDYQRTVHNEQNEYFIGNNELSVSFYMEIDSKFQEYKDPNKIVTVSVGGTVSLSDLLNIPLEVLTDPLEFEIKTTEGVSLMDSDSSTQLYKAKNTMGTVVIHVSRPSNTASVVIPGTSAGEEIDITINIVQSFVLNYSELNMAQGQSIKLTGVLGTGQYPENSTFEWETTDTTGSYITMTTDRDVATVTAKKETPKGSPVTVTMYWTDDQGITMSATCKITVSPSLDPIPISESSVTMQSGDRKYITVTGLNAEPNPSFVWVSSNEDIVTIEEVNGSIGVDFVAGEKTGTAIVTVINPANNACATCLVTVHKAMTGLSIDKGDVYSIELGKKFLELNAVFDPADATSTAVKWTSSNPGVATIDAEQVTSQKVNVNLLSAGTTNITVVSTNNKEALSATLVLTVTKTQIASITLKEKEINLCIGDKYTITPTITPANPDDPTLTWQTSNASVATVTNGEVTGLSVGTTVVTVSGGLADPVSVIVNVRNKLTQIAFAESEIYVPQGEQKTLDIIYTPSENIDKTVNFRSTDESVATVDSNGILTAVSEGMTMIIATSEELGTEGAITCIVHVTPPIIQPTDFTIDPTEKTIQVGKTFKITPVFTPADTSNQEVIYETLDEGIASVAEDGTVTGVAVGQTVIQVTAVESKMTALCKVKVESAVKFSLSPSSREIALGKSFTITKVISPATADSKAVWSSSDPSIAKVSSSGKVTAKKIGSCVISCTLTKYNQTATCRVKVARLRTTLKLNKSSIRINVGQSYRLKKTVWSNNSSLPSVRYSSKNKRIATVGTSSGKITGKRVGSTVITAKTTDTIHATAKCRVTVIRRVTGIKLNKTYATCYIGRTLKLKATVKPKNASIKKLKWSSSNSKVASVTSNGTVTGIAEGEIYVTAKTTDGSNKSARCFVKVIEPVPVSSIVVAQTELTMKKGDTAKLAYTVLPSNNSDSIKMASDNTRVVKISKGKVKAVGTGTANVTITATSGVSSSVEVHVVSLNKSSITMRQYDTETLTVIGTSDSITWYSANQRIATVANGKITGRGTGTTYIYAYVNGCKMGCKVKIVSVNNKKR